jgi:uncharacterized membrane-anchored protein YhcB (DUF1043 family)
MQSADSSESIVQIYKAIQRHIAKSSNVNTVMISDSKGLISTYTTQTITINE